ncbi:hypothetical protein [Blastococcus sp. PRF04-17]|uniref:hypothetical protein n=1 Tax=Blastococcus sp. PRF04-17 TaxID=2933797 RepID=UPI001FF32D3C|nr:hypothetical protein [Blastococcus sp. PRF04-17]UOY03567.1 hypothetical protein MVA48_09665 [Blastococcus sp. PRF04-17]
MTHSIDAPLPPPSSGSGSMSGTTGTTSGTSTTTMDKAKETKDVAVDEAKNVGQTAAQAGSQVASTAAEQAKEVAQETQRQAKDLLDQGRTQVKEQVVSQQQKAGQGLSSIASELRALADGTSEGAPGPARDLLQQASGMVEDFANKLQNREPAELLDEIRSFARRKPGMFLLGAAAAGVLAGRLTRGVQAAHSTSGSGTSSSGPGTSGYNYVDPAPTYSGYAGTTGTSVSTPVSTPGAASTPLPPPPYGTVPPAGSAVPPNAGTGWDDPTRRPGGVG